eukprot:scaffold166221_cov39-Tisochrysis_lutea.AAC.1
MPDEPGVRVHFTGASVGSGFTRWVPINAISGRFLPHPKPSDLRISLAPIIPHHLRGGGV